MNIENFIIGAKLKEFRLQAGLSLAKAAKQANVSPAFISMVENGKCGISFQHTHTLVTLYGKTFADLAAVSKSDSPIINLSSAPEVASEPGVKIFALVSGETPLYYSGFHIGFEPGATHKFDRHGGVEYVLVLEGAFELNLQRQDDDDPPAEVRQLWMGDTTSFPASLYHRYTNISDQFGSVFVLEIGK